MSGLADWSCDVFPAGAQLAEARPPRRIYSWLLLIVGVSPGHGHVQSRQEASKCIIWAFVSRSALEVSQKPKPTLLDGFQGSPNRPGDTQALSADGACSMLQRDAACAAFLPLARLIRKESQLRGVPDQLPSHALSIPM